MNKQYPIRIKDNRPLRYMRKDRGISQVELAQRMGILQATVSRLENGRDIHLSTLARTVAAMGGEVEITVRFKDKCLCFSPPNK